jgi:hypothetical protein
MNNDTHCPRFRLRIERGRGPRHEIVSEAPRIVIGSGQQADMVVDDPDVSPVHCELAWEDDAFILRDLNSASGTWLFGVRVREIVVPDEVRFDLGAASLSFLNVAASARALEPSQPPLAGTSAEPDAPTASEAVPVPFKVAKATIVARFEREYLLAVLARHKGNITASATAAELDRVHFLRLLDRHGLRKSRVKSA